ncbi:hypothetical protein CDL15_Pgr004735 [Punica granatum]|nr:hypothetical protein CDL15_Pgr004735 [Punica granatum]
MVRSISQRGQVEGGCGHCVGVAATGTRKEREDQAQTRGRGFAARILEGRRRSSLHEPSREGKGGGPLDLRATKKHHLHHGSRDKTTKTPQRSDNNPDDEPIKEDLRAINRNNDLCSEINLRLGHHKSPDVE